MAIGKKSGASDSSKMKTRDLRKTGEFKNMLRPGVSSSADIPDRNRGRVEAKKGGKMNAGLKAYLAKKKKMKKGKK
jgi:hypothetical protein